MKNNYIIRPREASDLEDFVSLRRRVFGDDEEFIKFFDNCFRDDYLDFLIIEDQDDNKVLQASLTQFDMGKLVVPEGKVSDIAGKSIEMSYAICTDPAARGKGYGSHITVYAREIAESSRKLSMLSPAEPSLIKFYEPLEYKKFMYAEQGSVLASEHVDFEFSHLQTKVLTPQEYNNYRETILANRVHIKLSEGALRFAAGLVAPDTSGSAPALDAGSAYWAGSAPDWEAESGAPNGSGLLLISDGAEPLAIAACESVEAGSLAATELLTFSEDGGHKELGIAIAKALAVRFGAVRCDYMMPSSAGSKSAAALGMISVSEEELAEVYSVEQCECPPYMGFTFG
nr:GNAT family N-acetyltransferase [uncultured Mogibacterium sp.]